MGVIKIIIRVQSVDLTHKSIGNYSIIAQIIQHNELKLSYSYNKVSYFDVFDNELKDFKQFIFFS